MTGIGAKQKPITSYPGSTASGLGDERWDRFGGMSTHSSALGRMAELRRKRSSASSNDPSNQLRQCVEQHLRLFQVGGIEAFREPAVDGG